MAKSMKPSIYRIGADKRTFTIIDRLPSMNMEVCDYIEIGILNDQYYQPHWSGDLNEVRFDGLKPTIPGRRFGEDGYRIRIHYESKLLKYKGEYYQLGGFTII